MVPLLILLHLLLMHMMMNDGHDDVDEHYAADDDDGDEHYAEDDEGVVVGRGRVSIKLERVTLVNKKMKGYPTRW